MAFSQKIMRSRSWQVVWYTIDVTLLFDFTMLWITVQGFNLTPVWLKGLVTIFWLFLFDRFINLTLNLANQRYGVKQGQG